MSILVGQFTNAVGEPSAGYVQLEPIAAVDGTLLRASALDAAPGNLLGIDKVRIPLAEDGTFESEVEPGRYQLTVVLRNARAIRGVVTIPDTTNDVTLASLIT